jgi:cyclopropane-fatty-acyl-phospholipid synthase
MGAMLRANTHTSLAVTHVEDIGLHYATTLKLWHENWRAAEEEIYKLGYSPEFFRKWRFYFSYCEAGFEQQFIHNYQVRHTLDTR